MSCRIFKITHEISSIFFRKMIRSLRFSHGRISIYASIESKFVLGIALYSFCWKFVVSVWRCRIHWFYQRKENFVTRNATTDHQLAKMAIKKLLLHILIILLFLFLFSHLSLPLLLCMYIQVYLILSPHFRPLRQISIL